MTIYSGKFVSHLGPTETEDAGLEFGDHICNYFSYIIHKKENKSQIRSIPVCICVLCITVFVLCPMRRQTQVKQGLCVWHSGRKDKTERKRNNHVDNECLGKTDIRCEV